MRRILGAAGRECEEGGGPTGTGDRTDNEVWMEEAIHGYIAACNYRLVGLEEHLHLFPHANLDMNVTLSS